MKLDKDYNFRKHQAETFTRIYLTIGRGIDPTNEELSNWWAGKTAHLERRTFCYIFDLETNCSFRSKGFSLLGLPDQWTFGPSEIMSIVHENHRKLVAFQTMLSFKAFMDYPELMRDTGLAYTTTRGMKHQNGTCFFVHQVGYPVQFDENGLATKYFNSFRIIGPYSGEALSTKVYVNEHLIHEQQILDRIVAEGKEKMLYVLGFSSKELELLRCMDRFPNKSTQRLAELLERSSSTISNHKHSIITKAKETFPLNDFDKAEDVLKYLQQQLLI